MEVPQLLLCENWPGFVPERVMLSTGSATRPVFFTVADIAALVAPADSLPNARPVGVTLKAQQSVDQLEKNERAGAITLASLRRAAEALDAELFYAIIPRKPLRQTIAERAKEVARKRVAPVAHSMQLEAQGVADNQLQEQITELALELERNPRELWR